jgi:hypothetical protein
MVKTVFGPYLSHFLPDWAVLGLVLEPTGLAGKPLLFTISHSVILRKVATKIAFRTGVRHFGLRFKARGGENPVEEVGVCSPLKSKIHTQHIIPASKHSLHFLFRLLLISSILF